MLLYGFVLFMPYIWEQKVLTVYIETFCLLFLFSQQGNPAESLITDAVKAEDVWSFIRESAGQRCLLISDCAAAINSIACPFT
jgi:hypothetical protein